MSKVAVIGNTARAIGAVCASDLALSGHGVRYTVFAEHKDQLPAVRKAGGFTVEGDAKHLISKKTGFARLDKICDTTREALESAQAVVIEVDIHQLEEKFSAMIPEFARGAVVPCVQLAEQAGIAVPLHRSFAEILGTLLGVNPWQCGPSLADMDLAGTSEAVKKRALG